MQIHDDFIANVEARMSRLKITRSELARRLNVAPATVTQMLQKRYIPTISKVEEVALVLGIEGYKLLKPIKRLEKTSR